MTVQDRCGRRNEPPPVLQFLSANKWREAYSCHLLADKMRAIKRGRKYDFRAKREKAICKI